MKYLIVHNRYSRVGGEEKVVAQQVELLRGAGHQVHLYERSYDEIHGWRFGMLTSLFSSFYNRKSVAQIKQIIKDFKPDVAIIHNLFPVISPAILPALRRANVKILMTVHNYRLVCPTGLFFVNGKICEKCGTGLREFNCIFNKCEGSFAGSCAFASRSFYARLTKKYIKNVDTFLVMSEFLRDKLVKYGMPSKKMVVLPNFINNIKPLDEFQSGTYVGFVGRLSPEKGVDFLIQLARNLPDIEFSVAGEKASNIKLDNIPNNLKMVGFLNSDELESFYRSASVVISTSVCYEGFPLSIIEAMSYGKPVLVPNFSVFPFIVDDGACGVLYQNGSLSDASDKLRNLLLNKILQGSIGKNGYKKIVSQYNSANYLKTIESVSYSK